MNDDYDINPLYHGPPRLSEDVTKALETLSDCLSHEWSECRTHSVIIVDGFEDKTALEAAAIYLVSAISQNIDSNLLIRRTLFDEENISRELESDVLSVIGKPEVDSDFKIKIRDPWMWEGISHMLIHLSRFDPGFHPIGRVLAKTSIKHDVHDHGLDLIAIYESCNLGISAGECKAYFNNPSNAITDASNKLGEVDALSRDTEIRSVISQLRSALDESARGKLAGAFWRDERCYLPFVCCDEEHARDWTRNRTCMRRLDIPVSRKILFPLSLPEARNKFDLICDFMRAYVAMK